MNDTAALPVVVETPDDEALAHVKTLTPPISATELARRFAWTRSKVQRRLRAWRKAGELPELKRRGRKVAVVKPMPVERALPDAQPEVPRTLFVDEAAGWRPPPKPRREWGHTLTSLTAGAVAIGFGAVGGVLNATYSAGLGDTPFKASLMMSVGALADGAAFVLPALSMRFRGLRRLPFWAMWGVAVAYSVMAAGSFTAASFENTAAVNEGRVAHRLEVVRHLEDLQTARRYIQEREPVSALQAQIDGGAGVPISIWNRSHHCADVSLPDSRLWCDGLTRLRTHLAEAQHRDELDKQIADTSHELWSMPAVTVADPGASMLVSLAGWFFGGRSMITMHDVYVIRALLIMLMMLMPGLLFCGATKAKESANHATHI